MKSKDFIVSFQQVDGGRWTGIGVFRAYTALGAIQQATRTYLPPDLQALRAVPR
jgi:hypothetical protein